MEANIIEVQIIAPAVAGIGAALRSANHMPDDNRVFDDLLSLLDRMDRLDRRG